MTKSGSTPRDARPVDPADRAHVFTITLREAPARTLRGRLTHVATGDSAHFDTADELVAMLHRLGAPR